MVSSGTSPNIWLDFAFGQCWVNIRCDPHTRCRASVINFDVMIIMLIVIVVAISIEKKRTTTYVRHSSMTEKLANIGLENLSSFISSAGRTCLRL